MGNAVRRKVVAVASCGDTLSHVTSQGIEIESKTFRTDSDVFNHYFSFRVKRYDHEVLNWLTIVSKHFVVECFLKFHCFGSDFAICFIAFYGELLCNFQAVIGEHACYHSMVGFKSSVYYLGTDSVFLSAINSWSERLKIALFSGHKEALKLALSFYDGSAKAVIGKFAD